MAGRYCIPLVELQKPLSESEEEIWAEILSAQDERRMSPKDVADKINCLYEKEQDRNFACFLADRLMSFFPDDAKEFLSEEVLKALESWRLRNAQPGITFPIPTPTPTS